MKFAVLPPPTRVAAARSAVFPEMEIEEVVRRPLKRKRVQSYVNNPFKPPRQLVQIKQSNPYSLNQGNHGRELKTIDVTAVAYEFSTSGTVNLINGVAQGTDYTTRVGRKLTLKSIFVRGRISVGSTPTAGVWRFMLVYDKQPNGAAFVATDLLDNVNIHGVQNLTNRDRFVIIMDKMGYLEAAGRSFIPIKKYIKCNLEVTFGGTGGTISSIQTGSLFAVSIGHLATGVTAITSTITTRVRFLDD